MELGGMESSQHQLLSDCKTLPMCLRKALRGDMKYRMVLILLISLDISKADK